MKLSQFLRTVLKLDAASCLVMAAVLVAGAKLMEPLLGMPPALSNAAGLSLIPIGLVILWVATRKSAPPALVYAVIFGNLGWTAASFASLALLPKITSLGLIALIGQAVAVVIFALLEWRGMKESMWVSAA